MLSSLNSSTTAEKSCVPAAQRTTPATGALIINADDWGGDPGITDRIYDCVRHGSVSSASGMVFMSDSERAAAIARRDSIDIGLHLNLTAPFTVPGLPDTLVRHQAKVIHFLTRNRFARVIFHPGLVQ